MLFLLFSIICSSAIIIIFKLFGKYKISTLPAIVYNYLIASVLGILTFQQKIEIVSITSSGWFPFALIIGILFIIMFFMLALSTQKAGVTATTVSSRVSVVIPIIFSIIYFKEHIYTEKIVGILLAVVAVVLSVYKKRNENFNWKWVIVASGHIFWNGHDRFFCKILSGKLFEGKRCGDFFSCAFFSVIHFGFNCHCYKKQ
jgi:drug/metabolite transporter (DMT)-like permease